MDDAFCQKISENIRGTVLASEPLKNHTAYRIGGKAECLVQALDSRDAEWVYRFAGSENIPLTVLGAGSNVIAPEEGIAGIVLRTHSDRGKIDFSNGSLVVADSGVYLETLIKESAIRGLGGFDHVTGIPGTVGGAIVMNAGTREGDTSGILEYVEAVTPAGKMVKLDNGELAFGYRHSLFQGCDWLILRAAFNLTETETENTMDFIKGIWKEREEKFPLEFPNAGSVFKRPLGDYAGRLIEDAGCKGLSVGGAMVSEKHANFIVNSGDATSRDIISLIGKIRRRVFEKYGVYLELEQKILDSFR